MNVIIIRHKIAHVGSLSGPERDTIVLNWEDRRRSRMRLKTTGGIEVGIALPTGTVLYDGDILYISDNVYIAVEAAKEDLIIICPKDMAESALIAYEVGNRHLPVSIKEKSILIPYNRQVEDFLKNGKIKYGFRKEVFEPVKKSYPHG